MFRAGLLDHLSLAVPCLESVRECVDFHWRDCVVNEGGIPYLLVNVGQGVRE